MPRKLYNLIFGCCHKKIYQYKNSKFKDIKHISIQLNNTNSSTFKDFRNKQINEKSVHSEIVDNCN